MAALHQMRISQVPLRPSEHPITTAQNQSILEPEQDYPVEKVSSLDHVRYNIVGE